MEVHDFILNSIIPICLFLGFGFCFYKSDVQFQNIFFGLFLISVSISSLIDDYGFIIEDVFLFSPLFLNIYINKVYQVKTSTYFYLLFLPGLCFYDWSLILASYDHFNYKPVIVLSSYFFSIVLLLKTLYGYQKFINRIKSNFSDISNSYQWINKIVILSSIWCLYPVLIILNDLIPFFESELFFSTIFYGQYLVLILLLFKILFIGFGTSTFSESIQFIDPVETDLNSKSFESEDNHDEQKFELFSKMLNQIQDNKMYLDPKLSLFKLSKNLDMDIKVVSNLINTQSGDNFYSFINKMRIKEFKNLIEKQEHLKYNLDSIANLSGFNSKSTFYRVFKDIEGVTPLKYISTI